MVRHLADPVVGHTHGVDPEKVEHWPWNVCPAVVSADLAAARNNDAPESDDVPLVADGRCPAHGCERFSASVRQNTHPEFARFCERHRHAARERLSHGRATAKDIADRIRRGLRTVGRPSIDGRNDLAKPGPKPLAPGLERMSHAARRLGVNYNALYNRARNTGHTDALRAEQWELLAEGLPRIATASGDQIRPESLDTASSTVEMGQSCSAQQHDDRSSGHRRERAA